MKAKQVAKDIATKKRGKKATLLGANCIYSLYATEKEEEAKARAAVKAQIEADKRERAAKAAREKALREGSDIPDTSTTSFTQPRTSTAPATGRDFKDTRLQIRLASGGQPLTTTLPSDSSAYTLLRPCELLRSPVAC